MSISNFIKIFLLVVFTVLFTSCVGSISGLVATKVYQAPICEYPPDTCAILKVVNSISMSTEKSYIIPEWPPDTLSYLFNDIPFGVYNVVVEKYSSGGTDSSLGVILGKYLNPSDSSLFGEISIGFFNLNHDEINIIIE